MRKRNGVNHIIINQKKRNQKNKLTFIRNKGDIKKHLPVKIKKKYI